LIDVIQQCVYNIFIKGEQPIKGHVPVITRCI